MPVHKILVLMTLVTSQGSGESVHPHSVFRKFTAHKHKVWIGKSMIAVNACLVLCRPMACTIKFGAFIKAGWSTTYNEGSHVMIYKNY